MKQTLTKDMFRFQMDQIRPNNFSYEGQGILFDYLEQLEKDMGEELDFDPIAFCCDFAEMTELEIRSAYGLSDDQSSTEFLENNSIILGTTDTTVVFQQF